MRLYLDFCLRVLAVSLCALFAAASGRAGAADVDYLEKGDRHFFQLEYDQAIDAYQRQRWETPDDPNVYNHIANAFLYKELHRFGMAQSGSFKEDNKFLKWDELELRPEVKESFEQYMLYGRQLAEKKLEESPADRWALYTASQNYLLDASYRFFILKEYIAALQFGDRAHDLAKKNIKHHPDYVDAYFVAGVQEYIFGSLPWYIKMVVALGGVGGNKEKGLEWVRMAAEKGDETREQARIVLTTLLRREGKPAEAAKIMESLAEQYPKNYVYRIELGSIYRDAGDLSKSLEILQRTLQKAENGVPGFGRMPENYRERLKEEIKKTRERMEQEAGAGEETTEAPAPASPLFAFRKP